MFTIRSRLLKTNVVFLFKKFKHKESHWSVVAKKKQSINKAMEHFDDFYKKVYEESWPSIRHGLLGQKKSVAVINYYGDSDETITNLENNGAINMKRLFDLEKEYIKERRDTYIRNKSLEQIYKMDAEMEEKYNKGISEKILEFRENREQELKEKSKGMEKILEQKEKVHKKEQIEDKKLQNSVEESLKTAEIDYSRIITPDTSDLSSALYEFIPATKLKGREDWIPETQHYKYYESTTEFSPKIEKEYELNFPEHLNIYCYEKSNHTIFPSPKRGNTGVYNYYLLDGASVLPVLALGLRPGDRFLDMCCAPGGKAIVALQTLYPDTVTCNDVDSSRVNRIENVLNQYLYDLKERFLTTGKVKITHEDGLVMNNEGYNRILVDVPCTNDRLSLHENDNNWFKGSRTKERLQLPETQAALLTNALKMISVGGTVVYSTCSLSPIQNDGVVGMALRRIWEETNIDLVVKDLSPALKCTQGVFRFADSRILRYGHLVVPYLPQNYGPMYFCKIERMK